ncbi:ubiquitin-related domain-containing protein [Mycena belliarum]|uniref:Ubiquitin-related domain-containing protein n=1 Tax=Mycena belliarum TaxID=1033014 RepID=A0AAD6U4J4_9AGAR|nr:ubiquitin-related domain-containing protein [Mycena belliae]
MDTPAREQFSSSLLPPHPAPYRDVSARSSTTRVEDPTIDMDAQDAVPDPAIGDTTEQEPEPEQEQESVPQTPQTVLTFLLVDGRRRTMPFDPDTTVARVKELVWSGWPSDAEWQDDRPPAPSYLRILYLGKILQDDDTLAKLNFPSHIPPSPTSSPPASTPADHPPLPPTIVHLSIRAYAPPPDDALKKKKSTRRRGATGEAPDAAGGGPEAGAAEESGGCCCVIC